MTSTFTAVIRIAGINPYVEVPASVVDTLGRRVLVKLPSRRLPADASRLKKVGRLTEDGWFRTTLVASRLYLDQWMRDSAGVGVGDSVRITLKPDPADRVLPVPPALQRALDANARAKAAWDALTPSRRREILSYLNFLKTPGAVERNVEKTIAALLQP